MGSKPLIERLVLAVLDVIEEGGCPLLVIAVGENKMSVEWEADGG